MKYFTRLFIVILAIFFTGCEEQEYMKSESEIKDELSYSWQQILMIKHKPSTGCMLWQFKDDFSLIVYMTSDSLITNNNLPAIDTLTGTFSVNTTVSKVFIDTQGFPNDEAWYWLNAEWNVVALDDKGLVIASEDPRAGGINEREFKRID